MKKIFITLVILSIISFLLADLNQNLKAKYLFNGNANDDSGNGNHGIIHNTQPTDDRYGNSDSAYLFGINKYITINSDSTLDITQEITMAAWIYLNSGSSSWQSIFCKGDTSDMNSPYALLIRNYKIAVLLNRTNYYGHVTVPTDEWVHIAITWNGTTIKYYINGNKDDIEDSYSSNLNIINSPLIIGMDAPGETEWFNGKLDDLYLYNRALSDAEIQQLYQSNGIETPANIQISIINNSVNLSWDPVNGSVYNVYSSTDPNIPFSQWNIETLGLPSNEWNSNITTQKLFYKVTAVK